MTTRVSFEFFPPQTDSGRAALLRTSARLQCANPEYFSVTYGAGGSTRERTFETVNEIARAGHVVAPHLSFGSDSEAAILEHLEAYKAIGVKRLVALRGDMPSGMGITKKRRYARDLVELVRRTSGDYFYIEVGAYPEVHPDSPSPQVDIQHFKDKVDAGANSAITQYFYNTDAYFDFVDRVRAVGIKVPIVPGVMPITNFDGLVRFSEKCGAEIPRWIRQRLEAYRDDEASLLAFGLDVVSAMCQRLIDGGAPSIHFYSMNKSGPSLAICKNLSLVP